MKKQNIKEIKRRLAKLAKDLDAAGATYAISVCATDGQDSKLLFALGGENPRSVIEDAFDARRNSACAA